MVVLRCAGVQLQGAVFDTMVADYLLAPGERNHNLYDLAVRYLNHATMEIGALIGSGRNPKPVDQVSIAQFTQYAGQDADVPLRLAPILERLLRQENLEKLFADLEMPLVEVLAELEHNGIKVDVQRLHELSRRFGERMQVLQAEVYEIAGGPFNIDSRIQLSQVLFEKLHLPVIKKTKSGPSTDADVLAELASLHALPEKIVQYRQDAKLKSTYVDALPALVHPKTGRVHTSFKQDVAATGRLSSTDPNLQNIPVRSKVGREIRTAFLPGQDGWQLVAGDYSQIELRILAHLSGDAALQSAFAEDRDIHAQVASEVYGIPLDQVTWDMRRSAKAINFGIIYGQSAFGLAKALSIDKQQAAQFIDAYFNRYVDVQKFIVSVLEQARRMGYVSSILGRRRAVQGVRDPSKFADARHRNLPERIAVNTVIQGSAADLIKQAMINVYRRLRRESLVARMLLQIHDELIFESPASEIAQLAKLVSDEMSSVAALDVPLKVDIKIGSTWADCEPITEGDPI
jgi:DNA polymerase-1